MRGGDGVPQPAAGADFFGIFARFFTCFHGNSADLRPCYHALRHPFGSGQSRCRREATGGGVGGDAGEPKMGWAGVDARIKWALLHREAVQRGRLGSNRPYVKYDFSGTP